ncbi:ABC transporter ATP-binding protein [Mobilicoccus pelagius]|uniref:Putative ABC transporter ATP-binding protein n=1 Tax=Mobilicoccus pelagius NBRC 104925 TaxID=1089455 RepID=H5UTA0_9MICO|nr:ABC transporter ATP-binding protein [Mobilicoccus pelagius]GAB48958.1 putative ABC transporter ATP-binding protein [Mobilicoccus pelagius NBRC 104925]
MTTLDATTSRTPADGPVCTVRGLTVGLTSGVDVVDGVDLTLVPGQIVGLVGESGSGKTTAGTALLGYARTGAHLTGGEVEVGGHEIREMSEVEVRRIRGVVIGYVPQDPSSALNPAHRIGAQLRELLDLHDLGSPSERDAAIRKILPEVGLPADDEFLRRYPHQLSGGQVQRVALAMVFLPRPRVLVLDEPTTGLDVTTQGMVLRTLQDLCDRYSVAALYVTHDLAVVARIADCVAVMYAGRLVEEGPAQAIFDRPSHPYTRALLRAIPRLHAPVALQGIPGRTPPPGSRPSGCRFHDRCEFATEECARTDPPPFDVGAGHTAACLHTDSLPTWDPDDRLVHDTDPEAEREIVLAVEGLDVFYGGTHVVHDVSFDVAKQEVVALVGESGSGKTTISRSIGGLHDQWEGAITYRGDRLASGSRRRTQQQRQKIQYVFQNPYASLNPRRTVEQILRRPLALFGIARGDEAHTRVVQLLDSVQLREATAGKRAGGLSGGERQRVAIARALAARPEVLVCDEITSALDVSIQASIVDLLTRIKDEHGLAMVFVTHDLALVRTIADRVLVLHHGRVVESGLTAQVLDHPREEYTRALLADTPTLEDDRAGAGSPGASERGATAATATPSETATGVADPTEPTDFAEPTHPAEPADPSWWRRWRTAVRRWRPRR